MPIITPAVIAGSIGLYSAISGGVKSAKANKMAANLKRPTYQIPQSEYDNLNLATSAASQGLSDSSRQILINNSDRGLGATLDTVLKGGGDVNSIGGIYDSYLNNLNNITLADDAAKVKNVDRLIAANYHLGNQQDKAWQVNEYAPYADKAAQIAQMKSAGQQQMNAGIGAIGGAAMSALGGQLKLPSGGAAPAGGTGGTPPVGFDIYGSAGIGQQGPTNLSDITGVSGPGSSPWDNNFTNNFGIDISKMNASDAGMVNSLLYNGGNSNQFLPFLNP